MSKLQDIRTSPLEHFTGSFDALNSYLDLSIQFILRIPSNVKSFNVSGLRAVLKLYNPNTLLSDITLPTAIHVHRDDVEQGVLLKFPVSERAIALIEKNRKKDVIFTIEIHLQVTLLTEYQRPEVLVQNEYAHPFQITIPRSEWAENILPKIGYRALRLFEIPLTHNMLSEAYEDIISEFELAAEYFIKPDYNKCVAHCRHTLDALKRNLKKIKQGIDSETTFKWLEEIEKHTFQWIDAMEKNTAGITAKSHHAGLKRDFTRTETESIYLVTLGLMNYIGNLSQK